MNENWYRPRESPKKAFLAGVSLLHDGQPHCVENWTPWGYYARWIRMDFQYNREDPTKEVVGNLLRPIHKHQKLIDLYWTKPDSKWMFRHILAHPDIKWLDCATFWIEGEKQSLEDGFKNYNYNFDFEEPKWYLGLTYCPHPVFEQELHEKFMKIINKNAITAEV